MLYTDGIHLVADDLNELHIKSALLGISRYWYHGVKKGHPHYDIPKNKRDSAVVFERFDIEYVRPRDILEKSREIKENTKLDMALLSQCE